MRKNTTECLQAFVTGTSYSGPRDRIHVSFADGKAYRVTWMLHGNPIADRYLNTGRMSLSTCGWNTSTTWDRLNAVANAYGVSVVREESMKYEPWHNQTCQFDNVVLIGLSV